MNINEDFYLIVGFWSENKTNIVEEYILYIPKEDYLNLFNREMVNDFKELLSSITNDKADDDRWKNEIKFLRNKWKETTHNLIRPRFKRDHKKQKRIQCAINNKDCYNYFIPKYKKEAI